MDGRYYFFKSIETELWFNLALEAYLLNTYAPHGDMLYLWQNDKCIVIGRYQNPWAECRLDALKADGVMLGRRPSGGGAVYQDLGNGCFTFANPRDRYDKSQNFSIVSDALKRLGLDCELSGRNDVMVEGRKVSGSAFQLSSRFASHHATMLVNADIGKVNDYLTPHQTKLQSKGVKSVASRIANLADFKPGLDVASFYGALEESYSDRFGDAVESKVFSKADLADLPELASFYKEFSSPDWIYGKTPQFTDKIEGRIAMGGVSFLLDVSKGVIQSVKVYSDTLESGVVETLESILPGCNYDGDGIMALAQSLGASSAAGVKGAAAAAGAADATGAANTANASSAAGAANTANALSAAGAAHGLSGEETEAEAQAKRALTRQALEFLAGGI